MKKSLKTIFISAICACLIAMLFLLCACDNSGGKTSAKVLDEDSAVQVLCTVVQNSEQMMDYHVVSSYKDGDTLVELDIKIKQEKNVSNMLAVRTQGEQTEEVFCGYIKNENDDTSTPCQLVKEDGVWVNTELVTDAIGLQRAIGEFGASLALEEVRTNGGMLFMDGEDIADYNLKVEEISKGGKVSSYNISFVSEYGVHVFVTTELVGGKHVVKSVRETLGESEDVVFNATYTYGSVQIDVPQI